MHLAGLADHGQGSIGLTAMEHVWLASVSVLAADIKTWPDMNFSGLQRAMIFFSFVIVNLAMGAVI